MRSYEKAQGMEIESREDIEHRAFELITPTAKSLDYLVDRSQFIQRHANKIGVSSTKLFIGSFLVNIKEIKTCYESIKSYFDVTAKLHSMTAETDKEDNSENEQTAEEKERNHERNNIDDIGKKMRIKSELEIITDEIISKSEKAKITLRNMKRKNNPDSSVTDAYGSFKDLHDTILKLDGLEEMIAE